MKILVASRSLPPAKSGSAFIIDKLSTHFTNDEMVILGGKTILGKTLVRSPELPRYYYQFSELNLLGRGARFLAFFRWFLFPFLILELNRIFKREKCDYILGVFPDEFFCFAAYLVARMNKARFSSYFHNTYIENRKGLGLAMGRHIQKKIFDHSEFIFVMSEGMQSYYGDTYGYDTFRVLVHTFKEYAPIREYTIRENRTDWRMVLIGNFNRSNIEATTRFVEAIQDDGRFSLSVYTPVPRILLKARGVNVDALEYMGFIDDTRLVEELQKYDLCVLTHGFTGGYNDIEYQTIFPTRTIPLLLSRRPIIAHAPAGCFLARFIRKHDCAGLVDEADPAAVVAGLEQIIEDPQRQRTLIENAATTVEMFHGPSVVANFKKLLGWESGT